MSRFLQDSDYGSQIKTEVLKLLNSQDNGKLLLSERKAIDQITNWLNGRYDCAAIFAAQDEARDHWIVTITIDIALYHLYSQTGSKDVPEHRSQRYQDALDWLKNAGRGQVNANLPTPAGNADALTGDVRINSKPPSNHRW